LITFKKWMALQLQASNEEHCRQLELKLQSLRQQQLASAEFQKISEEVSILEEQLKVSSVKFEEMRSHIDYWDDVKQRASDAEILLRCMQSGVEHNLCLNCSMEQVMQHDTDDVPAADEEGEEEENRNNKAPRNTTQSPPKHITTKLQPDQNSKELEEAG
jgi:hypothetical protein